MKKWLVFLVGAAILVGGGCKRKSDVLASYKGGNITRGQFHEWLEARRIQVDSVLKNKAQQKSKLQQQGLDLLTSLEAKKAGYDKTEEYVFYSTLAKRAFISNYLQKKLRDDSSFKDTVLKARIIKLLVKDYKIENNRREQLNPAETEKAYQEVTERGKSIIKELDGGADFAKLAAKYSDDYSKKSGGDIGWVSQGMRGPEFSQAVFALKKDTYTKEPVRIRNAVYIIKVDEREEVTNENIDDVIEDKNMAERLKRRLSVSSLNNFEQKLLAAPDVKKSFDKVTGSPDTVLFTIGATAFKIADLDRLISYISKMRQGPAPAMKFDDNTKKNFVERIFRDELMMREALKRKVDKEEDFAKEFNMMQSNILAMRYKEEAVLKDIKVTEPEILAEYNTNKDRYYTQRDRKGNDVVKRVMPLSEVKERIHYMLLNKKKSEKRRAWENDLIKQYAFVINEKKLEGK